MTDTNTPKICSRTNPYYPNRTYWLHKKDTNNGTIYYFSREIIGSIPLPKGYEVKYSKYGVPHIKKIKC